MATLLHGMSKLNISFENKGLEVLILIKDRVARRKCRGANVLLINKYKLI